MDLNRLKNKLIREYLELKKDKSNHSSDKLTELIKIFEDISNGENILSYITEDKINGLTMVDKSKKDNGKESNLASKEANNKLETLNKIDGDNKGTKYEYEGEDLEVHNQYEIKNGMEMIEYDREPSETFKKRVENGIKGSHETGNGGFSGDPKDFKKNHDEFSNDFIKNTKQSKEKRDGEKVGMVSMGDDIEPTNKKVKSRSLALEENKIKDKTTDKMSKTIKRLVFEKRFDSKDEAINRIPEAFKNDNNTFLITDKNETYKVRWEGNLNEGQAVVLSYENKEILSEEFTKMNELMDYSPKKAMGIATKNERLKADEVLFEMMETFKKGNLLKESEENSEMVSEEDEIDEAAFGDMFRSYDKIFMRDNKAEIDAVKALPQGEEKDAKAKAILAKANEFISSKGIETGSAVSLKNEIKRAMGYNVALRGGQS